MRAKHLVSAIYKNIDYFKKNAHQKEVQSTSYAFISIIHNMIWQIRGEQRTEGNGTERNVG